MNQEEIIELAFKAGFVEYELDDGTTNAFDKRYAAFAALVAAAEREACVQDIQMHIPRSGRDTTEYQRAMRMIEQIRARGETK